MKKTRILTVAISATLFFNACSCLCGEEKTPTASVTPVKTETVKAKTGTAKVVKETYQFDNIMFKSEKFGVASEFEQKLNGLADLLLTKKSFTLSINGHADSTGPEEYNLLLSQKRADAVKFYLHTKGICNQRMGSFAQGEKLPAANNKTAKGREQNRRVEIFVSIEN